jgi:hypothetical protein
MDDLMDAEVLRLHLAHCDGCSECRDVQVPASVARDFLRGRSSVPVVVLPDTPATAYSRAVTSLRPDRVRTPDDYDC